MGRLFSFVVALVRQCSGWFPGGPWPGGIVALYPRPTRTADQALSSVLSLRSSQRTPAETIRMSTRYSSTSTV